MKTEKFFATLAMQEKPVTLGDGSVEKLHFKKVGSAEWSRYQASMGSLDPEVQAPAMLRLIMFSLCEPDGKQALNWEQVQELDQDVMMSMWRAASDVNKAREAKKT